MCLLEVTGGYLDYCCVVFPPSIKNFYGCCGNFIIDSDSDVTFVISKSWDAQVLRKFMIFTIESDYAFRKEDYADVIKSSCGININFY